jgi:hypothetical protein
MFQMTSKSHSLQEFLKIAYFVTKIKAKTAESSVGSSSDAAENYYDRRKTPVSCSDLREMDCHQF